MISQATLHAITDRIGKQYSELRDLLGPSVSSVTGTADTICESLSNIMADELISDGDSDALRRIGQAVESLQAFLDVDTFTRANYSQVVRTLEDHISTDGSVRNGFEDFALANAATRYSSSFCRLAALFGYTFLSAAVGYYDGTDILGEFQATGAGTGTWTPTNFTWDNETEATYGLQPCSSVEVEANGAIDAADDITITAQAIEAVNGTQITLTATLSAGDPDGTTATMASATPYAAYVKEILSVHSTAGTSGDTVLIRFKPIRTPALD